MGLIFTKGKQTSRNSLVFLHCTRLELLIVTLNTEFLTIENFC